MVRCENVSNCTCAEKVQTYANNALGTDQLDELVSGRAFAIALSISLEVSEISYMANLIGGSTMSLAVWVDCSAQLSALSEPVCVSKMGLQWGPADVQPLVLSPN